MVNKIDKSLTILIEKKRENTQITGKEWKRGITGEPANIKG